MCLTYTTLKTFVTSFNNTTQPYITSKATFMTCWPILYPRKSESILMKPLSLLFSPEDASSLEEDFMADKVKVQGLTVSIIDSTRFLGTKCKVFNSISPTSPFAPRCLEAYISVLPKPGKEPTTCSNFRPISLINVDVKIFSKIISSRLTHLFPAIIQVGFVRGREARDYTNKTLLLLSHAQDTHLPSFGRPREGF